MLNESRPILASDITTRQFTSLLLNNKQSFLSTAIVKPIKNTSFLRSTSLKNHKPHIHNVKIDNNLMKLHEAYNNSNSSAVLLPAIYFIESTNECNLSCYMCPNKYFKEKKMMDFDIFRNIIDQISIAASLIRLNYCGEPLLNPNIIDMIKYAKENTSARVSLSTNGILLTHELSISLIESGLDEIIFSVDANSNKTYYEIKSKDCYFEVVNNIQNFINLAKFKSIKIGVKLIEMKQNQSEIESFKNKWKNINGCDVIISWLSTWGNQMPSNNIHKIETQNEFIRPRTTCGDIWFKMVIKADGTIPLCCYDLFNNFFLGNVRETSIEDIWNSEILFNYRSFHKKHDFSKIRLCETCKEFSCKRDIDDYLDKNKYPKGRP